MTHFYFFSKDSRDVIIQYLHQLNLGILDDVYVYELETGYYYMAFYSKITCPSVSEIIYSDTGTKKIIYSENEHGYPLYWTIHW